MQCRHLAPHQVWVAAYVLAIPHLQLMVMVIPCRLHIQVKEQPPGSIPGLDPRLHDHIRINLITGLIIHQE